MVNLKKLFAAYLFEWRKQRAIKKAQREADLQRRKYLVLVENGKPVVVSMQGIKKMIRQHRFTKGFTAETACKIAIYIAYPQPKNH